jgi:hypothetical protein
MEAFRHSGTLIAFPETSSKLREFFLWKSMRLVAVSQPITVGQIPFCEAGTCGGGASALNAPNMLPVAFELWMRGVSLATGPFAHFCSLVLEIRTGVL